MPNPKKSVPGHIPKMPYPKKWKTPHFPTGFGKIFSRRSFFFSRRSFFFSRRNFNPKRSKNGPFFAPVFKTNFSRRRRFSPGEVFSSPGEDFSSPGEVLPWIYWSWISFCFFLFYHLFGSGFLKKIFSRRCFFFSRRSFFFSRRNFYPKQSKNEPIFSAILNTNFSRRSFFFSRRSFFFLPEKF